MNADGSCAEWVLANSKSEPTAISDQSNADSSSNKIMIALLSFFILFIILIILFTILYLNKWNNYVELKKQVD